MTSDQSNKLAMYGAVEALLKTTTETSGVAPLPAALTLFSTKLGELQTFAGTQLQPTVGRTARRDELLAAMVEATLETANAAAAYAHRQGDLALAAVVDVTPADFEATRLIQRPLLAQRVHDAAAEVAPALAGDGVTPDTLAALQAAIDAGRTALDQPRTTIAAKKAATEQLAAAFAEIDGLLEGQIDRLLFSLRKTSPEFHAQYRAVRMIVSRPGGRTASASAASAPAHATPVVVPGAAPAAPVPERQAA